MSTKHESPFSSNTSACEPLIPLTEDSTYCEIIPVVISSFFPIGKQTTTNKLNIAHPIAAIATALYICFNNLIAAFILSILVNYVFFVCPTTKITGPAKPAPVHHLVGRVF
jgi:hypothetical protein